MSEEYAASRSPVTYRPSRFLGRSSGLRLRPSCGGQPERERKRHPARASHDRASGQTAPSGTACNTVKLIRIPARSVRIAIGRPRCM